MEAKYIVLAQAETVMQYVSRPKIFIQTVKKSPQGCSTSDLLTGSKLNNQCDETFIDSLC